MKLVALALVLVLLAGCTMSRKRSDMLYCIGACVLLQDEEPTIEIAMPSARAEAET